jgi:hypothetical protein
MRNTLSPGNKAIALLCLVLLISFSSNTFSQSAIAVKQVDNNSHNSYYISNKAPLKPQYFIKLPVTAIQPGGWLKNKCVAFKNQQCLGK